MPQNFIACDREQVFLMPWSVRDWLPGDHLAWFVIDAVAELDLAAFYRAYRDDGHGRAAYEPSMMVTLILYAYATKQRSSCAIERHCRQDVAYRGDRWRRGARSRDDCPVHRASRVGVGGRVWCGACVVRQGGVGQDGCGVDRWDEGRGERQRDRNLDYDEIAKEIVKAGKATDIAEDRQYGHARGDDLPEQLHSIEGRRAFLREAKCELDAEPTADEQPEADADSSSKPADRQPTEPLDGSIGGELDREKLVPMGEGRRGWLRAATHQLDERRRQQRRTVARSRRERLAQSKRRLEQELEAERQANEAYEAYRAQGPTKDGRRFGRPPDPYQVPDTPQGEINVTDPDSRLVKVTVAISRVTTREPRCQRTRSCCRLRSPSILRTSVTLSRSLTRPWQSSNRPGSPTSPPRQSRTQATGMNSRWITSSLTSCSGKSQLEGEGW